MGISLYHYNSFEGYLDGLEVFYYEDPFLCPPSTIENTNYFLKKLINSALSSMGKVWNKDDKVFDAYVSWYNLCFHCMTIKPFNGVDIFYCYFIKDFVSSGLFGASI